MEISMLAAMPVAQILPRLAMPALPDHASEPNPAMAVPPHSSSARPMERRTMHKVAAVPPERELHEDAVIHARSQEQRHGHQVEQIPRPAGQRHDREQAKPAQQQHGESEEISAGRRNASHSEVKTKITIGVTTAHIFFAPA